MSRKAIDFINSGISCNCLALLKEIGILDFLLEGNSVDVSMLSNTEFCTNYTAAYSALITLEKTGIINRVCNQFNLTEFGYSLSNYIGLITMLFDGYGLLIAQQKKIAKNRIKSPFKLMKIDAIAESSIHFGKNTVDPIIVKLFNHIGVMGTICDLGCGLGTRLSWLCKTTGNPGLGFENDEKTVRLARIKFKNDPLISFEKNDISNLDGVWEDVTVLMQCFVFHDFIKSESCITIINSYLINFPNLKYFIYIDIISPSDLKKDIMPGFDYVHGLLGIKTPTYEETHELFSKSDFQVLEEIQVQNLPNTFIWVLCPK